ncbi:MAG: hypothetical protein A2Y56_05060 [Candidatus Aminicenantes bacterium RBG_13_63_10]|nr:MAG: hypothetical protein A2Y56_05060 [Candidatus Aminicenantes bacterium RBG_13_63_10]
MKAMILAAGNGTSLRPLTDKIPKALVEVNGLTALELVVERLKAADVGEVVINVHHHAGQVEGFVLRKRGFGLQVKWSRERSLLDTGGALKAARRFFEDGEPFFVHNIDILSDIDLAAMMAAHGRTGALATLAVQERLAERTLLVDEEGVMCGHVDHRSGLRRLARRPSGRPREFAFCGIHVLSPGIFEAIEEDGRFSIIDAYLKLAGKGCIVRVFKADGRFWRDIGRIEALQSLLDEISRGALPPGLWRAPGAGDVSEPR